MRKSGFCILHMHTCKCRNSYCYYYNRIHFHNQRPVYEWSKTWQSHLTRQKQSARLHRLSLETAENEHNCLTATTLTNAG